MELTQRQARLSPEQLFGMRTPGAVAISNYLVANGPGPEDWDVPQTPSVEQADQQAALQPSDYPSMAEVEQILGDMEGGGDRSPDLSEQGGPAGEDAEHAL